MTEYKLYFLSHRTGRMERREDLHCDDDAEGVREAERLADGRAMELWQGTRLVKVFPAKEPG